MAAKTLLNDAMVIRSHPTVVPLLFPVVGENQ